jgi:predicted DNA-binding WGR domain protein
MIKIDLKNGYYGDYTFYKMQMVYDSNRELYIVLTRYGRIGDVGMHQRTPFTNLDEAKKEFHTIFKQKSSNEWETAHTSFEKHNKKYVLVQINYQNVKHTDYLAPFDYDNCAKTVMEPKLRHLFEEISNVTMYQRSMKEIGIDQSQLPVSALKKEDIEAASEVLKKLDLAIKELNTLRQNRGFGR